MPLRVCVAGVTGWTGRAVAAAVETAGDLELVAGVSRSDPSSFSSVEEALDAVPADVLVDYTHAAAATLALILSQQPRPHAFVLRTASGSLVGEAKMSNGDSRNVSLALTARHLPVDRGHMFVLWAGANGSSMQVGRFMVDRTGGCRVRFNLPESHSWHRFWVTQPGDAGDIVAST